MCTLVAMADRRRWWVRVVVAVTLAGAAALAAFGATGGAQTKPRCAAHADAQRQGYSYCGTDQYPR